MGERTYQSISVMRLSQFLESTSNVDGMSGCRMECCYVFDHAVILMFVSACKQGEGRERGRGKGKGSL